MCAELSQKENINRLHTDAVVCLEANQLLFSSEPRQPQELKTDCESRVLSAWQGICAATEQSQANFTKDFSSTLIQDDNQSKNYFSSNKNQQYLECT